jgi:hypothetical protein
MPIQPILLRLLHRQCPGKESALYTPLPAGPSVCRPLQTCQFLPPSLQETQHRLILLHRRQLMTRHPEPPVQLREHALIMRRLAPHQPCQRLPTALPLRPRPLRRLPIPLPTHDLARPHQPHRQPPIRPLSVVIPFTTSTKQERAWTEKALPIATAKKHEQAAKRISRLSTCPYCQTCVLPSQSKRNAIEVLLDSASTWHLPPPAGSHRGGIARVVGPSAACPDCSQVSSADGR